MIIFGYINYGTRQINCKVIPNPEYSVSGNRLLHSLTSSRSYSLRIDLADFENNTAFALYDDFVVNPENDGFTLGVGGYSGTAG